MFNSDGTKRSCPYGASVTFPAGTLRRVVVGDDVCQCCPCFKETKYSLTAPYVECDYENKK